MSNEIVTLESIVGSVALTFDALCVDKSLSFKRESEFALQVLYGNDYARKIMDHALADGISAVRQILPRCEFDEAGCGDDSLEGLRQYQTEWDDEKKIFSDKPLHNWASHYADGFRSLAMAYREVIAEAPKPKPRGVVVGDTPPPGWELPTYADLHEMAENEKSSLHQRI